MPKKQFPISSIKKGATDPLRENNVQSAEDATVRVLVY